MPRALLCMCPDKDMFKAAGCHGNRDVERHFAFACADLGFGRQ